MQVNIRKIALDSPKYIPERLAYCEKVKYMRQATLNTWGYTDGTVFYLDRTVEENVHTQRAALGGWVWRHTDARDASYPGLPWPFFLQERSGGT